MERWHFPTLLGIGTFVFATAGAAQTESSATQVRVTYRAPAGCGSGAELSRRIEARLPQHVVELTPSAPIQFTLEPHGNEVEARMLILLANGATLSRTIRAHDCAGAIEAIAFVAAVALDPGADDPIQVREEEVLEKAPESDMKDETSNEAPPSRHSAIGLEGRATLGPAPDFLWGGGITFENTNEKAGPWAPALRLSLGYSRRGNFTEAAGVARFELATAVVDLCPSQVGSSILRLRGCGVFEGGTLRATGTKTYTPESSSRPWIAGGASVIAEIVIKDPLVLTYRVAGLFPLIRDEFQFDSEVFHAVPWVTLELNAGLALRFQ